MPRKRPPAQLDSASRGEAKSPAEEAKRPDAGPLPAVPLAVFGALVLFTLVAFYRPGVPAHWGNEPRLAALQFAAAPDLLLEMWCGGKLEYFSIFDRWPIVLLTVVILSGAWLAGRLALALLGVRETLNRIEHMVFSIGVGLNLLSLCALAIGLAGLLQQRWVFVLLLIILLVANAALAWRSSRASDSDSAGGSLRRAPATPDAKSSIESPRSLWWFAAAAPFATIIVLGGMLPPTAYDVREYHLQAPKEWFQNGRIDFLPHNIYANMPLGSELNSLWAMAIVGGDDGWWWGALTGKTAMACYSLVTAAALFSFGRRIHSLAAGAMAAVAFLSTPSIVEMARAGYNEGPVAMYALLSLYALWLAAGQATAPASSRLVALSGLCAGSAVACKYPPALFLVVPLVLGVVCHWLFATSHWSFVIGHWSFEKPRGSVFKRALLAAFLFILTALAACGPWFAKNAALTNNPTYPLLYSLFDGRTRTAEKDRQWTKVHSPQPDQDGHRFALSNFTEQAAWILWRNRWANVALLPLGAMSLLARPQRGLIAALGIWMSFVFVVWWVFTHRLDRFLILLAPATALLAGMGAAALSDARWRIATGCLIGWSLVAQFLLVALASDTSDGRYLAPLALLRHDDQDPAHQWLNEHAQAGERVLLVGDALPFDLKLPAIYNTCFDDCQFTRLFKDKTRSERLAVLRQEKIAYIFFYWYELARYRSPYNYGYTSDYPTPDLVHDELVNEQNLLEKINLDVDDQWGELYRVAPR